MPEHTSEHEEKPVEKPGGRRARRQAEIRTRLLDAGQAIFLRRGVEEATIAQITEAAGVGFGTFYLYFPSKEALYKALVARGFAVLSHDLDTLRQRAQHTAEPWQTSVHGGVTAFFRFAETHHELLLLMFASRDRGDEVFGGELRTHVLEWARMVVRMAAQTVQSGDQVLADLQDLLVVTVIVLLRRSTVWWLRGEGGRGAQDLTVETISAALGRYIVAGVTAALQSEETDERHSPCDAQRRLEPS